MVKAELMLVSCLHAVTAELILDEEYSYYESRVNTGVVACIH